MSSLDEGVERRASLRLGTYLHQKWRIDRLLGVGGMAAVYSATHRNGKQVAIKILHPETSWNTSDQTRLLREGYAANQVDHPGAVSILDDGVDEHGTLFLVMDLIHGETVEKRWLRNEKHLSNDEVIAIGYQLLEVLEAAHQKGIIHRDVKPENLMIERDGQVKVLDFGIAHIAEVSASITRSGAMLGTPAYMSPEQARGRVSNLDGRSDLWAVGATLFTLLAGRTVHIADTINEHLLAAMTAHAVPISTLIPSIPSQLALVIDRALAFEKENRWPDATVMKEALARVWEDLHSNIPIAKDALCAVLRENAPPVEKMAPASIPKWPTANDSAPTIKKQYSPRSQESTQTLVYMLLLTIVSALFVGLLYFVMWGAESQTESGEPSTPSSYPSPPENPPERSHTDFPKTDPFSLGTPTQNTAAPSRSAIPLGSSGAGPR